MRDTKRFVSGKLMGLVNITCPNCKRKFRVALAKIELPAVCTFCNTLVEKPADHHKEATIEKLKIPLKGKIVTSDGSVDLEHLEAESDAYTGGRNAFAGDSVRSPVDAMTQGSADAAESRRAQGASRKNTRRIRARTYRFVTIIMVSLVAVGVAVFIWQMIVHFGQS